jgi:hypothetical protein
MVKFIFKEPALEKQYGNYADKDGRVGDVEYGAKEQEELSALEGYPFRKVKFKDGEEEHVYNLAMKPGGWRAHGVVVEHHTVEGAVYYITYGAAQYKGHAPKKPGVGISRSHFPQVISNTEHGGNPECGKGEFAKLVIPPYAEGHAWI